MPQPSLPPTPGASTDIPAKESRKLSNMDQSFALPPSAMGGAANDYSQQVSLEKQGESFYMPSPTSPRVPPDHATSLDSSSSYVLPPPPTRSRKIIQMKPRQQKTEHEPTPDPLPEDAQAKSSAGGANGKGKRKQGASTSQGRKIARKTAHSLIERRRRSKMNEEFATLKDMIPACNGQEMHKLAILQASIEYLRYLEQCVDDLKANGGQSGKAKFCSHSPTSAVPTTAPTPSLSAVQTEDSDDEMEDSYPPQPEPQSAKCGSVLPSPSISAGTSPAFSAQSYGDRRFSRIDMPSPAFGPQSRNEDHRRNSSRTTLTNASVTSSPTISPQKGEDEAFSTVDREASAALLMLNANDRRSSTQLPGISTILDMKPVKEGRAMSVKDLLHN